jgi:uncharacterized protein (TIGR03435 family)
MAWLKSFVLAAFAIASIAQTAPEFEAASVKPHTFSTGGGRNGANMTRISAGPTRLTMNAVSAGDLIQYAYGIPTAERIAGRPEWLYQTSYDVVATTAAPVSARDQKLMLRKVLADRFQLVCRLESRDAPIYALRAGSKPKLSPAPGDATAEVVRFLPRPVLHDDGSSEVVYSASHATVADLASWLSSELSRPVRDETAIEGLYDFKLSVPGPPVTRPGERPQFAPSAGDSDFIAALQSQLGLRIQSGRGPVETLVIDRIEKPSAN